MSEQELREEVAALRSEVAALRSQLGTTGLTLGPRRETQADIDRRTERLVEALQNAVKKPEKCPRCGAASLFLQPADIERFYPMWACRDCGHVFQFPPPADRSALCTTNGKTPEEVRAGQTNATGQHEGYIVLCDAERAKGFVRPYRDAYRHVGRPVCGAVLMLPNGNVGRWTVRICDDAPAHEGDCGVVTREVAAQEYEQQVRTKHALGGCGTVTTMGRALSETYARDPKFYGLTFCCGCNTHRPVAEFVWTADGAVVGS